MDSVVDTLILSAHESKPYADATEVASEVSSSVRKVDFFHTDTSDFEELLYSSSAEPAREQPVLIPADFGITVSEESNQSSVPELTHWRRPYHHYA